MKYLSTAAIGKLCGCTRVWAFNKARNGFFDEFKIADWHGKHYRFKDCPKLRAECRAIKADRERARLPRPKSNLSAGVSTWQGLSMQFFLMRRQIGEKWKEWNPHEIAEVRQRISMIVAYDRQLAKRQNFLRRYKRD